MEASPVRYARNGTVQIAYTVVGNGPIDLVYAPGIWTNCEIVWEEPTSEQGGASGTSA